MSEPVVIVNERAGKWASAVARLLPPSTPIRQTRGLAECDRQLALAPGSLVVLEVGHDPLARTLHWLAELGRRDAVAGVVIVAPAAWQALEWPLREAGAVYFATSPRALAPVAHTWACQLKRPGRPKGPLVAQIWDALPWRESAVTLGR